MFFFFYLVRAFTLLRCLTNSDYRSKTTARWKQTPTHLVVYEIGGGLLGLLIIIGATWWIYAEVLRPTNQGNRFTY